VFRVPNDSEPVNPAHWWGGFGWFGGRSIRSRYRRTTFTFFQE
jgi:hypothetical protein